MKAEGNERITVKEVARLLSCSVTGVRYWIRKGYLTLHRPPGRTKGRPAWLLISEVRAFAAQRERERQRQYRWLRNRRVQPLTAGLRQEERFITLKEAAALLRVTLDRAAKLARERKLPTYRPTEGHFKYLLPLRAVETLREDPHYLRDRSEWENRHGRKGRGPGGEVLDGTPAEEEAEWLTAEQVGHRLGISYQRVYCLRRSGRLPAVRCRRLGNPNGPLWRFHRDAIQALLDDPKYQQDRAKYQKAEATTFNKQVEWTLRVNGWDRTDHEWGYEGWPGGIW